METKTMAPAETMAALGVTVESVFVPFSQSRNKDQERPTLNWRVTVKRNGRDVLTTDYSAGIAHCTGYKAPKAPASFRAHSYRTHNGKPYPGTTSAYRGATPAETLAQYRDALAAAECESGVTMELDPFGRGGDNVFKPKRARQPGLAEGARERMGVSPIMPDPAGVVYSLVMDSSVLDAGGFAEWASDFGYDTDSRQAESIYRACLDIALKMRAAFGDDGLRVLQEAFQDY